MTINNLKRIEEKMVIEIMGFILETFNTNNIKNNLNVCSELILISRIIQKRIRENQGIKTQKNPFIDHELKEILEEIKKDDHYNLIKDLVYYYDQKLRNKMIN